VNAPPCPKLFEMSFKTNIQMMNTAIEPKGIKLNNKNHPHQSGRPAIFNMMM
jgi:hypothetical protein